MRKSFFLWLAMKIARTMLYIKATTYKKLTEDPYKWACGMSMRIYNDNRMMLANFKHRERIIQGFVNKIRDKRIDPDYIIGTMTSGVAWAAAVAKALERELLVYRNGKYYVFGVDLFNKYYHIEDFKNSKFDVIITNTNSIPYGIQYADKLKKGFAYVRSQKDHGKKLPVEGILKPGMKFVFLYSDENHEDIENSINLLQKEFGLEYVGKLHAWTNHKEISSANLFGLVAVVIEDLFSTGGSSCYEVYMARKAGMVCNYCFSIFSYGFKCLEKQFTGEINISNKEVQLDKSCDIDSLLPFSILMGEIKKLKFYPEETIQAMQEEIDGFDKNYEEHLQLKDEAERC